MEQLAITDPRRHEILRALERCLDSYDSHEDTPAARGMLREVTTAPASRTAHKSRP